MQTAYFVADGKYSFYIEYNSKYVLYDVREQRKERRDAIYRSNIFMEYTGHTDNKTRAIAVARKRFPEVFEWKNKVLHIPIGCAGSGKSTLADSIPNIRIISPDHYRIKMLDSHNTHIYYNPSIEHLVWTKAYRDLEKAMRDQINIYFDATNLTAMRRTMLIILAREYGYKTEFHIMETSLAECISRNSKREKRVPVRTLIEQFKKKELPTKYEFVSGEIE